MHIDHVWFCMTYSYVLACLEPQGASAVLHATMRCSISNKDDLHLLLQPQWPYCLKTPHKGPPFFGKDDKLSFLVAAVRTLSFLAHAPLHTHTHITASPLASAETFTCCLTSQLACFASAKADIPLHQLLHQQRCCS